MFKDDTITDLDVFINTNEFAVEVTLTGGAKIKGIFDDEFRALNIQDGQIASSGPQVICKSADVATVGLNAVITINAVEYKVKERQPDGTGLTTLILSKD
ncbi:MAG: hypothetical protein KKH94_11380 [Candidatus Omnitrophica bacterium]|nr:hypothetical protein [Candidatus Omnitrophota bacterium]